jgi:hypothetical protein
MRRKAATENEKGVALFLCLFALLLLSSIAFGLMFIANTETAVNYNYRASMQAYYAARAGAQEGVDRLRQGVAGYSITPPATMPSTSAGSGVVYIINKSSSSENVRPWLLADAYYDNELCNEKFVNGGGTPLLGATFTPAGYGIPCGSEVSGTYYTTIASADPNTNSSSAMPYKWVRITQKQNATNSPYCPNGSCTTLANSKVCWDGSHEKLLSTLTGYTDCEVPALGSAPMTTVYLVTALARTRTGARRMYQVEYAPAPPINVGSAVASKAGVNLTGQLSVNGYDQCSCTCTTSGSGSGQTTTCTPRYAGGTCDSTKSAISSGGGIDPPNSSELVVAGVGPTVPNISPWPSNLEAQSIIDQLSPAAVSVSDCSSNNCGALPSPFPPTDPAAVTTAGQVSLISGNPTLNGGGGSGVLLVNGDLTIHGGGFQWYGLIVVKGVVTFQGGGSAGTNIVGAVISGQEANANTTLGGSVVINLDVCAIRNAFKGQPLTYISSRELLY